LSASNHKFTSLHFYHNSCIQCALFLSKNAILQANVLPRSNESLMVVNVLVMFDAVMVVGPDH
jgi:hypothetical protein